LKFAGFFASDGTVVVPSGGAPVKKDAPPGNKKDPALGEDEELRGDEESQIQTLYLDSNRKRKITIKAPLTVTKNELDRTRAWLGIVLIVEGAEEGVRFE
jgi:hypothetical protein